MEDRQPDTLSFPITPERFWIAFAVKLSLGWTERNVELEQFYNHAPKSWTHYMKQLLLELGATFGCHAETEYRTIDVVYVDRPGSEWDEWSMEAAIEVENFTDWTKEIGKLTIFNAGLKVLITYEDSPTTIEAVLNQFIAVHRSRKYVTANCAWLFIFGPRTVPSNQHFTAFKSDGSTITEITGAAKVFLRNTVS